MKNHVLSRSAIVSKNPSLLVQALKNEDDLVWFEKLCALSHILSDQQKSKVLEDKLKKYTDVRILACTTAIGHTKGPPDLLENFKKQYKTQLEPQQYEQLLGQHIECLLELNVFPMEENNQQKIWCQINSGPAGLNQPANTCFQNAVKNISWDPSVLMDIVPYAVKGYYLYNFDNLFTKSVSEEFFKKNFQAIDWCANISKGKLQEKYLWMDALCVLPLNLLTQLLEKHPNVAHDPLFVDKAAYHPHCFQHLLHMGYSHGMSLDVLRSRLEDWFFIDQHDSRQKGFEFLEEIAAQQQKEILLSNMEGPSLRVVKRKM